MPIKALKPQDRRLHLRTATDTPMPYRHLLLPNTTTARFLSLSRRYMLHAQLNVDERGRIRADWDNVGSTGRRFPRTAPIAHDIAGPEEGRIDEPLS